MLPNRPIGLLAGALFLLATSWSVYGQGKQPCWLENPATSKSIGQTGVARNINPGGKTSPLDISMMRAVSGLCNYLGMECNDDTLREAVEKRAVFGKRLYFTSYTDSGYVYAYAGFHEPNRDMCAPSPCDIAKCEPRWLCTPGGGDKSGMLGISYRAMSLQEQYRLAVENALFQAEYLYGVNVTASKSHEQSMFSRENFTIHIQQGEVDLGERENVPFHVSSQCKNGGTLYRHVLLEGQISGKPPVAPADLKWLKNPKYKGLDGAVGSVENPVASGLVSDQIKLAIKRAAIQLAFEKNSLVSENAISITYGNGGLIQINEIREESRANLKARVVSIHFEPGSAGFLKVFVWIALL
jgi:hypothetical protein